MFVVFISALGSTCRSQPSNAQQQGSASDDERHSSQQQGSARDDERKSLSAAVHVIWPAITLASDPPGVTGRGESGEAAASFSFLFTHLQHFSLLFFSFHASAAHETACRVDG